MVSSRKSKRLERKSSHSKIQSKRTSKKTQGKPHSLAPTRKTARPTSQSKTPSLTTVKPAIPVRQPSKPASKVMVDRIEGATIIGDLIVVFPWTRETLLKHGLKLDVDEAGDIYMSIGAFAAIQGLKTETLVRELVDVSRQPPPPKPPPVTSQVSTPQLATPPTI